MNWAPIVGDVIFFSPIVLLPWGWLGWLRTHALPRGWRQHSVMVGLACASISCVCSFGVVLYLRMVDVTYWNEYLLLLPWARFNWPLSVAALLLAAIGKGASRILLLLTACGLVAVWTSALIH